jgi:transposase
MDQSIARHTNPNHCDTSHTDTTILALDLGKFKSVACIYLPDGSHTFTTLTTSPQAVHDLLVEHQPHRLVIEVCTIAGWVADVAQSLNVQVQVANPNHEGWRWQRVKRKTDRDDALKLARLSAAHQIPQVHMPGPRVRQWRSLIVYRHKLVQRRTAIRNTIRALLDSQGLSLPAGSAGWSLKSMASLREQALPIDQTTADDLWRGQLHLELMALSQVDGLLKQVETKLDDLGAADERVRRLRTIPGVGPRLGELAVALLDDPHRFKSGREVGSYAGLTPKRYQSGTMDRQGRISGQGPGLLRKVLVEVAWGMRRHNSHAAGLFDRLCKGQKTRRKQAAVAMARKILVWCWAMLRDGTNWKHHTPRASEGKEGKTPPEGWAGSSCDPVPAR